MVFLLSDATFSTRSRDGEFSLPPEVRLQCMARGWGRNEEELEADKEQDREARDASRSRLPEAERKRLKERRALELALARIREQLPKVRAEERRRALETARAEFEKRLAELGEVSLLKSHDGR
jgi:hypothetical protein